MKKNKIKPVSGNGSKKMNSKTWLIGGITAVILIVVVVLLYSQAKGTSFGKAVDQSMFQSKLGEVCIWEDGEASDFYVISKFKDAVGKSLPVPTGWEGLVGCCGSKSSCIAPNECAGAGDVSSNYPAYLCDGGANGDTSWMVCDANGMGKLSKDKNGVEGKYYCDGQKWVSLEKSDAGKIIVKSKIYWDGEAWHKINQKGSSCNYIAATSLQKFEPDCYLSHDALGYGSTTTCDPPTWLLSESYTTSGRVACCAEKNQCAKVNGDCAPKGTIVDTLVCDGGFTMFGITFSSWNSAKMEYKSIPSGIHGGGKYVSDGNKWVKCDKDGQTLKQGSTSYLCKSGKWISPEKCKSCKAGESCVFSDEYQKSYSDKPITQLKLLKQAEDAGRIACGKSTQCITAAGGKVSYDVISGDADYVCGDSNRWLKCNSKTKDVVSDGGSYICDSNNWLKIENQKKGCTNCASSEYCVASQLYPSYSDSWSGLEWAYDTKRVGCTPDINGCADTAGVSWFDGSVKDNKYICSYNKWYTCSESSVGKVAGSYFFCAGGDTATGDTIYAWIKCGSDGGKSTGYLVENKQTLCTKNGWNNCEKTHISDADTSWLCVDGKGWSKCDSPDDLEVAGLFTCDGSKWKYNYFDPSGLVGGVGGEILPLGGPVGVRSGSPPILGAGKR